MRGANRLVPLFFLAACGAEPEAPPPEAEPPVRTTAAAPPPAPSAAPCDPQVDFRVPEREGRTHAPVDKTPELLRVREVLAKIVQDHARDPDNPWAVGHAILALGPDVTLTNGEPAVGWLFEEYARPEGVGVGFPERRGDIRIEPHTDLVLKALTEAGLAPDHPIRVDGDDATLADLYRQSLCGAWVSGSQVSYGAWNDTPWALQGLAAWAPPDLAWSAGGHDMSMAAFSEAVVDKLHEETAFMRSAMASGATVQKRKQGIFGYTCGGAHLIQGAQYAVARGFGSDAHRQKAVDEIAVLFWRVDVELSAVDQAVKQHPEYAPILLEQRMKFLGHFLETVHKASALGLFTPDEAQQAELRRATDELVRTVGVLEQSGILGRLAELRPSNEQLYLDFVGDAAHALRGIDLATGRGSLRF